MKTPTIQTLCAALLLIAAAALLAGALPVPAHAAPINGGFESGLTAWTTADQLGGDGAFTAQTGTASPVNGFAVPPPPQGAGAAMTDALGPGSHVLYQDFLVPAGPGPFAIGFSLLVRNGAGATDFFVPGSLNSLDFATPALSQHARVDVLTTTADPFSVAPADVLQNLFLTSPGDPLVSGYTPYVVDVTAVFQAHAGQTLRLRFADVDNVSPFNLGVDAVVVASPWSAVKTVAGAFLPGGTVTYTVVLTNGVLSAQGDNPGDEFTDVLPPQLALVSATATSGTTLATLATNTVTWNGPLATGGTVTITIQATVNGGIPGGTTVANQGVAFYDGDGDGTNDLSTTTDDPAVAGAADPTQFVVAAAPTIEVPALDVLGLAALALSLAGAGALHLRRRVR